MGKFFRILLLACCVVGAGVPVWAQKKAVPAVRALTAGPKAVAPQAGRLPGAAGKVVSPSVAKVQALQSGLGSAEVASWSDPAAVQGIFFNKKTTSDSKNWKQLLDASLKKIRLFAKPKKKSSVIADLTALPEEVTAGKAEGLQREVYESYKAVMDLWKARFAPEEDIPVLRAIFMPQLTPSETALKTNKLSLFFSRGFADKSDWLRKYPGQGKNELVRYQGEDEISYLASRLSKEKLVFFGETHHHDEIQYNLASLLNEIRQQNPNRRIVLFTEFIDLPPAQAGSRNTIATYYRRVPETPLEPITFKHSDQIGYALSFFFVALMRNVEVYPLEDPTQFKMFHQNMTKAEFLSLFALSERNKIWARVIEEKMTEIRKQDPEALFLVYAGVGHTSWLMPFALPKFFAGEHPVVLNVTSEVPSRHSLLYHVWGKEDPFFVRNHITSSLYYWTGENARLLGRQVGFDYAWAVPQK